LGGLLAALLSRAHLSFWAGKDPFERWLALGCACAIIGLMAQGLVDTVFYRPQVQLIFWLVVAITVVLKQQSGQTSKA
jgi:putative inorganic carbon (HCO3(-)) transporter